MNHGIILRVLAVGVCVAIGHTLQCYKCDIGLGDMCLTSEITCPSGEVCYSGNGKAVGLLDVKMKGCLATAKCNMTHDVNFPSSSNTTVYTMTKMCCDTNLCNSAPSLSSLSRMTPLAIATFTTVLMVKVLV